MWQRILILWLQHGRPLQIVDVGETAIDRETFDEYLQEMRVLYTADKVSRRGHHISGRLFSPLSPQYHLLEFNCNSFTNDVVGFLTGNSIPSWISGATIRYCPWLLAHTLCVYRPSVRFPVHAFRRCLEAHDRCDVPPSYSRRTFCPGDHPHTSNHAGPCKSQRSSPKPCSCVIPTTVCRCAGDIIWRAELIGDLDPIYDTDGRPRSHLYQPLIMAEHAQNTPRRDCIFHICYMRALPNDRASLRKTRTRTDASRRSGWQWRCCVRQD